MYRFIHYLKTCQEIKSKQKEFGFVAKSDFDEGLKKRYNDTVKIQLDDHFKTVFLISLQ
jgi:hypothetical protein